MTRTGGQMVVDFLIEARTPYIIGIPGHGCLALADALIDRDELGVILPREESAGVHMADGFCRASGQPLAVFTSIGPGACNTVIGAATCYADSIPVLIITGDTHVHMMGRGVLQEIERSRPSALPRVLEPVVKRSWHVTSVKQLPFALAQSWREMTTGRRGPAHLVLPMDVQADSTELALPDPAARAPGGRMRPPADDVEAAARLLLEAERPVIIAGGGALYADAAGELREVAEHLGAAVITTLAGKSVFPEDHALAAWLGGSKGTTCGNELARSADVMLAVGCRFADETTSSYRHGVTLAIPPTKLVQIDIDPQEIGKNYPVEVALAGDAKAALSDLYACLVELQPDAASREEYAEEIATRQAAWLETTRPYRESAAVPMTVSRMLAEVRAVLPWEAIVVHSSGNTQAQILQEFPFKYPKTCITTGGFSTMGWTLPAALGAKLARPDTPVVGTTGDGDFLMNIQELATAVQYRIPVVIVVANNMGWIAIKDLQCAALGEDRTVAVDFVKEGETGPNLAGIAREFGCFGERVEDPNEIAGVLQRALDCGGPAVIECMVERRFPDSGAPAYGWWDVPVPAHMREKREKYERESGEERL